MTRHFMMNFDGHGGLSVRLWDEARVDSQLAHLDDLEAWPVAIDR